MNKITKNQTGFGVTGMMFIVVIILLGVMGYLVYRNHHKTTTNSNTGTTSSTSIAKQTAPATAKTLPVASDPYTGWKTGTLQFEQITYKYPASWTVKDTSEAMPKSANDCVYPGIDKVTLSSPTGSTINLIAGEDCF